jgi:hypothetical protein
LKRKLIILLDLWGRHQIEWLDHYVDILSRKFQIKIYDSLELADIQFEQQVEKGIHQQFLQGGNDKAVNSLLDKEKQEISLLGFSIGGTIGWKANLKGLKVNNFVAVSSTRLRYETIKPPGKITLFYGNDDEFKPPKEWFLKLNIKENYFSDQGHKVYHDPKIVEVVSKQLMDITIS